MELASKFTDEDYKVIREFLDPADPVTANWHRVLSAFERRISERFLKPVELLLKTSDGGMRAGFACLALDCLLIDILQSFREGRETTGEGTAKSFKTFLKAAPFSSFNSNDRAQFFGDVRNGLLHNGETRSNWIIRKDTSELLVKDRTNNARVINRDLFHAAVKKEYDKLLDELRSGDVRVRDNFLRRLDAICGLLPPEAVRYFAYGSNLCDSEIERSAPRAKSVGRAFLPLYRVAFDKHSVTRGGDAANLVRDPTACTWGWVYKIEATSWRALAQREAGYQSVEVTAVQCSNDGVRPIRVKTFIAEARCGCGPREAYLSLVIEGALERHLPDDYIKALRATAR